MDRITSIYFMNAALAPRRLIETLVDVTTAMNRSSSWAGELYISKQADLAYPKLERSHSPRYSKKRNWNSVSDEPTTPATVTRTGAVGWLHAASAQVPSRPAPPLMELLISMDPPKSVSPAGGVAAPPEVKKRAKPGIPV